MTPERARLQMSKYGLKRVGTGRRLDPADAAGVGEVIRARATDEVEMGRQSMAIKARCSFFEKTRPIRFLRKPCRSGRSECGPG